MRRVLLLLCALAFVLPTAPLLAGGGEEGESEESEVLRRSVDALGSYPGGPVAKAPLSTGYYVTDNDAPSTGPPWNPTYQFIDTTGTEARSWRRVLSGPNQRAAGYWDQPGSQGLEYFRNPNQSVDSTGDAIAGPISIGFPFFYYGRKYDSFYVSTNGLVALTNRRYQYDEAGNRVDYEPIFDGEPIAPRTGNPLTDPALDNYGYEYVALGQGTNWYGKTDGGIRNGNNNKFPSPARTAGYAAAATAPQLSVLAPLWDNCELSQYDPVRGLPDDFGRVYWRRDQTGNKLIIYFVNLSMTGTKFVPILNTNRTVPNREIRADFQVVLDRTDSSVQFNYSLFRGVYQDPAVRVINVPSNIMFRSNATIGIQSHDQEFTNYLSNADNGGAVYVNGSPSNTPHNSLAIKFKQWKNVVRVLKVTFQVPSRFVPGQYIDLPVGQLPNNFELLLGDQLLGVVKPVGVVENVSSDVGPVNVTLQPIRFFVVFRIRDLVNTANPPVYQRTATTRSLYPIQVAPGQLNTNPARPNIDTIKFDPYITNAAVPRQAGRFRAEVIALDGGPGGVYYGQQWPFDDTTGVTMFGIKKLNLPFINTFSDYDISPEDGIIPSVNNWVSIGAQVVDGDANCYNPPPPRGPAGNAGLNSPVCVIDRRSVDGGFYKNNIFWANNGANRGGDTLLSFPINLSQSLTRPLLILSYQRSGRQQAGYPRGYADATMVGPEHTVWTTQKTAYYQFPDYIVVEFAEPSANAIDRVVNIIPTSDWQTLTFGDLVGQPRWQNLLELPRWGVFGGSGGSGTDTTGKIVVDEFDAGKDFEFYRAVIPIPTRWSGTAPGNQVFRFRIRGVMKNDSPLPPPADDGDLFFVDNVMVVEPDKPEVEVTTVKVDWPYSEAPASQARAIPLAVKLGNNGSTAATAFGCAVYVENRTTPPPPGFFSYYRYQSIIALAAGRDREVPFPSWNAQECGSDITPTSPPINTTDYRIFGRILPASYDSYGANDVTYTDFRLTLGPTFAYDDGSNDVPNQNFSGQTGKGLNLVAPAQDGDGLQPFGPPGGSNSGTFAMQFRILVRDTITGYKAYYAGANQSPDYVLYSIYKQPAGTNLNSPPLNLPIASTRLYALRGQGTPDQNVGRLYNFDQFVTVELDTPLVVDPGVYFATVAQLGQTGLELGGDAGRMGQVTTIRSDGPPRGAGNYSIPAHPEFRQNRFWFENTTESGGWNPMINVTNNPGYPHLNWIGTLGAVTSYTRGSWIPMIRPYFGDKLASSCLVEPVELASFELTELSTAIRLDWTTATELNNHGFHVERRLKGVDDWSTIGFRQGAGNSNQPRTYNMVDENVVANTVYQYRLRQEDRDGSVNYSSVREGRIRGAEAGAGANSLSQNVPNPVQRSTRIEFSVVESGPIQIVINDALGNVVRAFSFDVRGGELNAIDWDCSDATGAPVPNGAYLYKLVTSNGSTIVKKMTVAR